MTDARPVPAAPPILDPSGKPARQASDQTCPGCFAICPEGDETARVRSGGFGVCHDVCVRCGYEWNTLTLPLTGDSR